MVKKIIILIVFSPLLVCSQSNTRNQTKSSKGILAKTVLHEGDTIPYFLLPTVTCSANRSFKNNRQRLAWERLRYNVKKVYPYAILAAARLKEYDKVLSTIKTEKDRQYFTKILEEQLKKEFEKDIRNMTMSQGRILIKLIDRETGKTSYQIVKDMRGSLSAFMWQSVAFMFNSSLKSDYDPEGEDKNIELAIRMIEDGQF